MYKIKTSLFVKQNSVECAFSDAASWVILNPIELSIKNKIEKVGVPLKDWDIKIYRGILTGCNEAFIISEQKRNEILSWCRNESEKHRTDELIRPILRGRDIKRYGYSFANLYLIASHNGIPDKNIPRINIDEYPAVKRHLDQYWDKISKRADMGDTPYNLRSCAYMDDFSKQKIIYPNMTKYLPFVFDPDGFATNQKCFIVTGHHIAYLTAFFNSSLFKYCFRDVFPELQGGTRELSKIFFDKIPVMTVSEETNNFFESMVISLQKKGRDITLEKEIDQRIFDLYGLSAQEREQIGFYEII